MSGTNMSKLDLKPGRFCNKTNISQASKDRKKNVECRRGKKGNMRLSGKKWVCKSVLTLAQRLREILV